MDNGVKVWRCQQVPRTTMKVMMVSESDVDQEVLVLGKENPKEEQNRKDHDKI